MGRCSERDFLKEMTPIKLNWSLQSAEMQMHKEQNFTMGEKGWREAELGAGWAKKGVATNRVGQKSTARQRIGAKRFPGRESN